MTISALSLYIVGGVLIGLSICLCLYLICDEAGSDDEEYINFLNNLERRLNRLKEKPSSVKRKNFFFGLCKLYMPDFIHHKSLKRVIAEVQNRRVFPAQAEQDNFKQNIELQYKEIKDKVAKAYPFVGLKRKRPVKGVDDKSGPVVVATA